MSNLQTNCHLKLICGSDIKSEISEHMSRFEFMSIACENGLRWMPHNSVDHT